MAVTDKDTISTHEEWYETYRVDPNRGTLDSFGNLTECAQKIVRRLDYFKREHDQRTANYHKYEKQASAEVVSEKKNLPNVSSGDSAGYIERIAKSVVQHTPNVEIICEFKKESVNGRLADYFLKHKIIGDNEYSNSMHGNLLSSTERALSLGFDCVIPVLTQDSKGSWYMQYDTINYRDVFIEPGAKDIRRSHEVYVRRYLTTGDVKFLIRSQAVGWDIAALKALLETSPMSREYVDHESKKHRVNTEAYEVITLYTDTGDPFLTFDASGRRLLRIEKNKHPRGEHPVFFLVLKEDPFQPYGKSVLSKTFGRQEFQDLFLNGAMKMWARNIDPPIFGFGTVNAVPNLSPGTYTQIANPNAKVEAFEISPQSLMMFSQIAGTNTGNISQLLGASDQQMAAQATGGMMSQTPQGVEAQQEMVDTTTNNFQKRIENFFSEYLSYAMTIYFQELKGTRRLTPDAAAREGLLGAGMPPEAFAEDGSITTELKTMAVEYWVKVIPGTLVEEEKEKQMRLLNQIAIPLSQSMQAFAASGDPDILQKAATALQFIVEKQIELSGSDHAGDLVELMKNGSTSGFKAMQQRQDDLDALIGGEFAETVLNAETVTSVLLNQQEQLSLLRQGQAALMETLGVAPPPAAQGGPGSPQGEQSPPPGAQGIPDPSLAQSGPETQ